MILGNIEDSDNEGAERTTLDDLFRSAAARRPEALALCDPPNRSDFTDGKPRRLTYAQADRAVSAIAGRLRRLGLSTDSMVGLQLPNTVESVLTFLGVQRAGLIATPLPLLWRRTDAAAALNRIGGKAFITASRVGSINHCDVAMNVAADVFPIRYVCCFGNDLADGVIPLDDMLGPEPLMDPAEPHERRGNPAAHVAAVTFEMTPGGLVAVARSHAELIAGGRAVRLETDLPEDAVILASCGGNSFAGLSASTVPWLLCGGTLSLHHPFDAAAFAQQFRQDRCDTVILPGPLVPPVEASGLLPAVQLRNVVALWRTPERLANASAWPHPQIRIVDVQAFGETAVICGRRTPSGEPAEIPLGLVFASRNGRRGPIMVETTVTPAGTLAIRGPMVPHHPFPPGADRARVPSMRPDDLGFVDTHYPCRADRDHGLVQVTGPPAGIVSVGGYRFRMDELQKLADKMAGQTVVTALPDALAGHRLAGRALDRRSVRQALDAMGLNPLLCQAFPV